MIDDKQRMMAAHLGDLFAHALRSGAQVDCEGVLTYARWVLALPNSAEGSYCDGLAACGLTREQIDDAVASVKRGEHPLWSLPGRVKQILSNAENDGEDLDAARAHGRCDAYDAVLNRLGCAPAKEPR